MTVLPIQPSNRLKVDGQNSDYAIARSTCHEQIQNSSDVGQRLIGSTYYIYRWVLQFDTSVIPAEAIISQVNLKLRCTADYSDTDFDVGIGKYDWSAYDPVTSGNREAVYDGILATGYNKVLMNTADAVVGNDFISENLDIDWLNLAGITYYALISSREYANIAPTGEEWIRFGSSSQLLLMVTYTIPVSTIQGVQSIQGIQSIQF